MQRPSDKVFRNIFEENKYQKYSFMDKVKASIHHIKMVAFGKWLYSEEEQRLYLQTFEKYLDWKKNKPT